MRLDCQSPKNTSTSDGLRHVDALVSIEFTSLLPYGHMGADEKQPLFPVAQVQKYTQ